MDVFITVSAFIFLLYAAFKTYLKLTTGWCESQTCLIGKTAIITGANTGIGYATALDLAKRGARVILACRDQQRAETARATIVEETANDNVVVKIIDMASFESVRKFAKDINTTEQRLDVLVNNAGALGFGDKKSPDGHDLLMQVNHFSPFLLTNLLIGLLKKSKPSRIINVSSVGARSARNVNLDEIERSVSDYRASKLCNILFTMELAKKLEGTGVTTYSLHPGLVKTEIFRGTKGFFKLVASLILNLFAKNSEEGAQTTIHCCVARGIENHNGEHFSDCRRVAPYKTATGPGHPKKLWEISEKIAGLKAEELQF